MENYQDKFFSDTPITDPNFDYFGYSDYAKQVTKAIVSMTPSSEGYVLAITGEWGIGKTSFINLIEYFLKSNDDAIFPYIPQSQKIFTIHFNP
jgi:predicted KAP-like P-loop ATPase